MFHFTVAWNSKTAVSCLKSPILTQAIKGTLLHLNERTLDIYVQVAISWERKKICFWIDCFLLFISFIQVYFLSQTTCCSARLWSLSRFFPACLCFSESRFIILTDTPHHFAYPLYTISKETFPTSRSICILFQPKTLLLCIKLYCLDMLTRMQLLCLPCIWSKNHMIDTLPWL